jgi:hypothetical protein
MQKNVLCILVPMYAGFFNSPLDVKFTHRGERFSLGGEVGLKGWRPSVHSFVLLKSWGWFLNRVQVENLQIANLIAINLFTSSLELAKFSTWTRFKNRPLSVFTPRCEFSHVGIKVRPQVRMFTRRDQSSTLDVCSKTGLKSASSSVGST